MTYYTSMEEHPIDILNLPSLEERVKANMERGAFGYIRGGSEDEWTLRENTRAFDDLQIIPRVLQGLSGADLSTSIFGISLKTPVIEAPSAAVWLMSKGKSIRPSERPRQGPCFP